MPAPRFRLHQSKTENFFIQTPKKTLDFFNKLCYNKDNEMNRSEPK